MGSNPVLTFMFKQELFEMYHLKEMSLSAEFFLSCSILQLTFYAISTAYNRKAGFVMLNQPIYYIGSLLLGLTILLLLNEDLLINNYYISNNSIVNDYLSFVTKLTVCLISLLFLIIINISFRDNPIQNNFEYVVLLSISVLGLLLLCSSNDLITAYLAIELQSIAFYIMAAFKKNSAYSIESGLKYFIIGSLSSAFFLFGSAILYGCLGSLNFDDFRMFSSILFPSTQLESNETSLESLAALAAILKLLNLDIDIRAELTSHFDDTYIVKDNWIKVLFNSIIEEFYAKGFHQAIYDIDTSVTHTRFFFDTLDRPSILLDNISENDSINTSSIFPYDLLKDIGAPSYPEIVPIKDILSVDLRIPLWVSDDHPWISIIGSCWPSHDRATCGCIAEESHSNSPLGSFVTYTDALNKCLDTYPNYNLLSYYNFNVEMLSIKEHLDNFDIFNSEPNYFLFEKIYSSYSQSISSSLNNVSDSVFLDTDFISIGFLLVCISLLIKLAVAPFHYWSLDVYEGSPNTTTVFFAVIPKIGLFVLLVRICYSSFYSIFIENYQIYFILLSVFSIFVGSLGGLEQRKIKTLFAYSSISHTGYLLLSFSTGSVEGTQMMFYYLVIYMISSLCFWAVYLFLIQKKTFYLNKNNKELGDFVLLKESNPMLSLILALTLFSIAGIPPVVGFLAKIGIFLVVVKSSAYLVAVISVLLSVISTFYYIRFIKILYFDNSLVGKLYLPISTTKSLIISLLAISLVILCIDPTVIYLAFYKASLLSNY